jgi:uncharacterized protein
LTYVGNGYSPAFVAGMIEVVDRLNAGSAIVLVSGTDDICAAHCRKESEPHCLKPRAAWRDLSALREIGALIGDRFADGLTLETDLVEQRSCAAT